MDLVLKEHFERNLIFFLVFAEVDIAGAVDSTEHILNAGRHFKHSAVCNGSIEGTVEAYIFIFFCIAIVYIADKFQWLHGSGIDITFIHIAYFIDPVVRWIGFAITHYMINNLAI